MLGARTNSMQLLQVWFWWILSIVLLRMIRLSNSEILVFSNIGWRVQVWEYCIRLWFTCFLSFRICFLFFPIEESRKERWWIRMFLLLHILHIKLFYLCFSNGKLQLCSLVALFHSIILIFLFQITRWAVMFRFLLQLDKMEILAISNSG